MTDSELSKLIISAAIAPSGVMDESQEEGDTTAEMELRQVTVPASNHGSRLDRALA